MQANVEAAVPFSKNAYKWMHGEAVRWQGNNGQTTYARFYRKVEDSDDLRLRLMNSSAQKCIALGNEYSNDPHNLHFRVVKEFVGKDQRRFSTCYAYAIGTFGSSLEEISGIKINTFQEYLRENDIDPIVSHYFQNVEEPRDGDLAVCTVLNPFYLPKGGELVANTTHAGICRYNDAGVLCIESKWGWWQMPYVFEHLPFFSSPIDGELIRFYRLKDEPVAKENNAFAQMLEESYTVTPEVEAARIKLENF